MRFSVGPEDFYFVDAGGGAEAEVQAEIVLREVAATAADFAQLLELAGGDADAGVEGEAVGGGALEIEADPVVLRVTAGLEDHGWAGEIFYDDVESSATVEEVAYGEAAADLGNLNGGARESVDVFEGSVALVVERRALRFKR